MRNHKVRLLAAAALMSMLPQADAHANATLFGDGRFSFSLSIEPNGVPATATPISIPGSVNVGVNQSSDYFQLGPNGDRLRWQSVSTNSPGNYVALLTGGASAPYTSSTDQFEGSFLQANQTGSGSVGVYLGFTTRNAADTSWIVESQKSMTMLWGSVSAADRVDFVQTGYTATLRGSDILAAASSLGFTGNNNSYYVTVNAVGTNSFRQVSFLAGAPGNTFEFVPLQYDSEVATVNAVLFPPPVVVDVPAGAPAPVLGASPVGGMLGLGMLGFIGLGRRRVSSAAARAA